MDRLFGKELSNLIDPLVHNKSKQPTRLHSQSMRSTNEDATKMLGKRFNRSSVGQKEK
jgi:hypothetical protein